MILNFYKTDGLIKCNSILYIKLGPKAELSKSRFARLQYYPRSWLQLGLVSTRGERASSRDVWRPYLHVHSVTRRSLRLHLHQINTSSSPFAFSFKIFYLVLPSSFTFFIVLFNLLISFSLPFLPYKIGILRNMVTLYQKLPTTYVIAYYIHHHDLYITFLSFMLYHSIILSLPSIRFIFIPLSNISLNFLQSLKEESSPLVLNSCCYLEKLPPSLLRSSSNSHPLHPTSHVIDRV